MSPDLRAFLLKMFELSSCTSDVSGVRRVQEALARELESMGFKISYRYADGFDSSNSAPFLIAERSPRQLKTPFITFVSHADTVDGFEHSLEIDEKRQVAIGQGVLDDKASQVVALWGLKQFLQNHPTSNLGLRFVSSPNEEVGSVGFHKLYKELSRNSELVLGFEPASENGDIIVSRRGNRWYRVGFCGLEAHAGRAPHLGINAAYDLARSLVDLEKLNQYEKKVSVSVGSINSSRDAYNVTCGDAVLKIDFRFPDFEKRDSIDKKIRRILTKKTRGKSSPKGVSKVTIEVVDDCPPMARSKESEKFSKWYLSFLPKRKRFKVMDSGGSADVCFMSRPGLPVLDGLGAIGGKMHSTDEWVSLSSVQERVDALTKFLSHYERYKYNVLSQK